MKPMQNRRAWGWLIQCPCFTTAGRQGTSFSLPTALPDAPGLFLSPVTQADICVGLPVGRPRVPT